MAGSYNPWGAGTAEKTTAQTSLVWCSEADRIPRLRWARDDTGPQMTSGGWRRSFSGVHARSP
ncbi:hypothetical protein GCM10025787_06790 [Saccharopolyspora rosea]